MMKVCVELFFFYNALVVVSPMEIDRSILFLLVFFLFAFVRIDTTKKTP